jgi:hypothetical protein
LPPNEPKRKIQRHQDLADEIGRMLTSLRGKLDR